MSADLVFAIDGFEARLSDPVRLQDAGPGLSGSYTDWIVQYPQLLGPRVRVVASDLQWESQTSGACIDVLGLDHGGRLVVGVVVVDDDPDHVLSRALTQAAYASRLDPQTLAGMHARHLRRQGQHVAEDVALHRMVVHTGHVLDAAKLARTRIVLFTEQVSQALSTTVVWLDEMGLDIALQRLQAYQVGDQSLLIVSRAFPQEPVTEFEAVRSRHLRPVTGITGWLDAGDRASGLPPDVDYELPPSTTPDDVDLTDSDVVFTNGFGHRPQRDD